MTTEILLGMALVGTKPFHTTLDNEQNIEVIVDHRMSENNAEQFVNRPVISRELREFELSLTSFATNECELLLTAADGLADGQLLIECHHFLRRKLMSFNLPKDRLMNDGLRITLTSPRITNPTSIRLASPTEDELAHLYICAHEPTPEGDIPQLISVDLNLSNMPIVTAYEPDALYPTHLQMMSPYQLMGLSTPEVTAPAAATNPPLVETYCDQPPVPSPPLLTTTNDLQRVLQDDGLAPISPPSESDFPLDHSSREDPAAINHLLEVDELIRLLHSLEDGILAAQSADESPPEKASTTTTQISSARPKNDRPCNGM